MAGHGGKKDLEPGRREGLLETLRVRFEANMDRHPDVGWDGVQARLEDRPEALWSLGEMERTGGEPDAKTSSWLLTPPDIRERGGAVFADYRYGHVFLYHNGAESYYAARGFRCVLRV